MVGSMVGSIAGCFGVGCGCWTRFGVGLIEIFEYDQVLCGLPRYLKFGGVA